MRDEEDEEGDEGNECVCTASRCYLFYAGTASIYCMRKSCLKRTKARVRDVAGVALHK